MGQKAMIDQKLPARKFMDLLIQANALRHKDDYHAAVALYREAVEQYGETAELCGMIAQCYLWLVESTYGSAQDDSDFIDWVKKAIASMPNNSRLHVELGEYYSLVKLDYEQAMQEYRAALELNPSDVKALIGIASLYGVPENVVTLNEAIQFLERATHLESHDPNYLFRLGELYYEAGRSADAEQAWLSSLLCPQPLDVRTAQIIETLLQKAK